MNKLKLLITFLILCILPCNVLADEVSVTDNGEVKTFVYHIPDNEEDETPKEEKTVKKRKKRNIVSDDITADTSGIFDEESEDSEISENFEPEYPIEDMYTDVLQGYASYDEEFEDPEDTIVFDNENEELHKLKISSPLTIKPGKYYKTQNINETRAYSKFSDSEYAISPISGTSSKKFGKFSAGTTFNQRIDTAELESSTGIFSRYDTTRFALTTSYTKTVNSINNNYNDNFYFTPELKLNQYFTLKEILSADISRNRKKAEFVLSVNPFGNRDFDRLRFEFGASATYDDSNTLLKNRFKFSTKFKL